MLDNLENKMMPAPDNKSAPAIHPTFARLFELGWKITEFKNPCGGRWAWFRPTDAGPVLHGCICHKTPRNP